MSAGEILVIGAGPAGLAAARAASAEGARVVLIDDNPRPGGQYYRHPATAALAQVRDDLFAERTRGAALLDGVGHPLVTYVPGGVFYGAFADGVVAVAERDRLRRLAPGAVVVAAGASERPMPFPGWTLPGVIGAGAVQNLLKAQRTLPGRRILVAGNGPLSLLAAANLVRCGAGVLEVLEISANRPPLSLVPNLLAEPAILARGLSYRATLARHRVPFRARHAVLEAMGHARVEEVVMAPLAEDGTPDRTRARTLAVDTVVTGFGLVPATEVTRALGCEHTYDAGKGGWIPVRTAELETSRAGVFAAGDCAGAAGAENALIEGELAGLMAAVHVGAADRTRVAGRRLGLGRRLLRLSRFRRAIEAIYRARAPELAREDTIICRCEEVTLADARRWLQANVSEINSLKTVTRVSMGRCQGRNCLSSLAALIAQDKGVSLSQIELPRPRPPSRPIPVGALAAPDD